MAVRAVSIGGRGVADRRERLRRRQRGLAGPINTQCVVRELGGDPRVSRRLMHMGLVPGSRVSIRRRGPFGEPVELAVEGGQSVVLRGPEARGLVCEVTGWPLATLAAAGVRQVRLLGEATGSGPLGRPGVAALRAGARLELEPRPLGRLRLRGDGVELTVGRRLARRLVAEPIEGADGHG